MELPASLRRLENKIVSEGVLRRYLNTESLDDLILTLRYLERDGYFKVTVTLSSKYRDWAHDRQSVLLQRDVLNPPDPFGVMKHATFGLGVKCDVPLNRTEVSQVLRMLSNNMAERYLQFRLQNINQEKLLEYVEAGLKSRGADEDELYDRIEYNGLAVDGVRVTYDSEDVDGLSLQHRQLLRLLMKKKGGLCFKSEFTRPSAGIFKRTSAGVNDHALRNLIYDVRKALRSVTNTNCIKSTHGEGWYLTIDP